MTNHPTRSRSRLAQYGARLRTIDGLATVEMVDPNDNARARHQYRRTLGGGLEHRMLRADGSLDHDDSPWRERTAGEIAAMAAQRGEFHRIVAGCLAPRPFFICITFFS